MQHNTDNTTQKMNEDIILTYNYPDTSSRSLHFFNYAFALPFLENSNTHNRRALKGASKISLAHFSDCESKKQARSQNLMPPLMKSFKLKPGNKTIINRIATESVVDSAAKKRNVNHTNAHNFGKVHATKASSSKPARMCGRVEFLTRQALRICVMLMTLVMALPSLAEAVRLKDVSSISGIRNNQITGYGLVVGLGGTGDKRDAFTSSTLSNMLDRMGISADSADITASNVASVMVTANLPATAKAGSSIDVTISSIGSSSSLQGGVLLQTPLTGIDGQVYALAQGPLLVGGYAAGGAAGGGVKSNTTTVAAIPGGATVEREIPFSFNSQQELSINMHIHDFSTTQETVESLNKSLGGNYANALDASTIKLQIPPAFQGNLVPLMASIENLEINPQNAAKVVVNEKTGTIVIGKDVRLARVAVAHGNLQVTIQESTAVSQPNAFSGGTTVQSPVSDVTATEETRNLNLVEGATLQELVDGLNSVGANPRDLITILRTLKASGSLFADLEVH